MKKATLLEILRGAQSMKNAQEVLKKLCKNTLQSGVEVVDSWLEDSASDSLKRSLDDYRDMLFQHDLSLKPVLTDEQVYE